MAFIKQAESLHYVTHSESECNSFANDENINDVFRKFATELKLIAPKAKDFLYFSTVMMHAAEASAIDDKGNPKLTKNGEPVEVSWDVKNNGAWIWKTNDKNIKPYKNSNSDIFPEQQLIIAHKKWVGKPLCVDHKSDSVEHIRGIIVDTYYDRLNKRVIALCALDKINHPELARNISTGVSNNVSMGTGVSSVTCFDCAKVASTEKEFCDHMRFKSGYGEINTGLNPIELSIVMNGADPKAKLIEVLAAAKNINDYVKSKNFNREKVASRLDELKEQIKELSLPELRDKLKDFEQELEKTEKELDKMIPENEEQFSPGHEKSIEEKESYASAIEYKLDQVIIGLEKIASKLSDTNFDENNRTLTMTIDKKSYFQGGGGVNEPAPKTVKYPIDPTNQQMREKGDKQMVGQHNGDVGPTDGMSPGPDSVGMKEEERKKMLHRASLEERTLKRANALKNAKENLMTFKNAYFQGGGEENEPTPGKQKYKPDPMNEKVRDKDDKQMVGQKPFPGVGDVEKLHPSPASVDEKDELKRKEMLHRASLKAKFVKAANSTGETDLGNSAWQVFAGDKLVLTASVNDITGGQAERLYDTVATREFGGKMLEKIRSLGIDGVKQLYKGAQAPPPAPAPESPAASPSMPEMPAGDMGGSGDPKDAALELAEQVAGLASDTVEAVRGLVGEKKEMGELEGKTAATKELIKQRVECHKGLDSSLRQCHAELKKAHEEMVLVADAAESIDEENKDNFVQFANEAFQDAKIVMADAKELLLSFAEYAESADKLVKRANSEKALAKSGQLMNHEEMPEMPAHEMAEEVEHDDTEQLKADLDNLLKDEHEEQDMGSADDEEMDAMNEALDAMDQELDELADMDLDVEHANDMHSGDDMMVSEEHMHTKEARAEHRMRLTAAAETTWNPILHDAHPKGGTTMKFDTKPEGNLAHVEDLEEAHEEFMDVVKATPKVQKQAAEIHRLVSEGKLDVAEVDSLVAEGVDPEAVKYYKDYWKDAGKEGSEFATELVKEHNKAQLEEHMGVYRVKIARAYELATDMMLRGLLPSDSKAVSAQVDEVMKWNDEGFESMKRVIARHNPVELKKTAGKLPSNGLVGFGDPFERTSQEEPTDLKSMFEAAFAGRRY